MILHKYTKTSRLYYYAMTVISLVATILFISKIIVYSNRGFDFTDEGLYLVSISNPFAYDFSISQFGFVYHPLYKLLGANIAALRQANILITFGLASGLAYAFLISLVPESKESRALLSVVATGLATTAFIVSDPWLLTPSYNSLAFQALLIAAIGLLLCERRTTWQSIFGWVSIAVGGWLAFMAKPSTAVALAVCVLVYLLVSRKFSIRLVLLSVGTTIALLLLSALLIDGSVTGFIQRLHLGVEFAQYLSGRHTFIKILRIDVFRPSGQIILAIIFVFIASFLAMWGSLARKRGALIVSFLISLFFFSLVVLLITGEVRKVIDFSLFQGLLICGVALGGGLAGLIFGRAGLMKNVTAAQWTIAGLFLTMPHIYAFGTDGNYWESGSSAGFFWLLASLPLLVPMVRERGCWLIVLPLVLAAQAVTTTLLHAGLERPYRQPEPLRLDNTVQKIGPGPSTLRLSAGYAAYIKSAMMAAQEAGFEPDTPVIDLSGQSPGILYALRAQSLGQAWMIGGYPGSLKLAEVALRRIPCKMIAKAWVLFEPNGPRSIPIELMSDLGTTFPAGYEQVGTWRTAEGAGGYAASRTQQLYKPTEPSQTLGTCHILREREVQ